MLPVARTHSVRLWRYGKDVICRSVKRGKQPPYQKTSEYGVESDPAAGFAQGVLNG